MQGVDLTRLRPPPPHGNKAALRERVWQELMRKGYSPGSAIDEARKVVAFIEESPR